MRPSARGGGLPPSTNSSFNPMQIHCSAVDRVCPGVLVSAQLPSPEGGFFQTLIRTLFKNSSQEGLRYHGPSAVSVSSYFSFRTFPSPFSARNNPVAPNPDLFPPPPRRLLLLFFYVRYPSRWVLPLTVHGIRASEHPLFPGPSGQRLSFSTIETSLYGWPRRFPRFPSAVKRRWFPPPTVK